MQRIYCDKTDFSDIDKNDPYITIYGDSSNNTVKQSLIQGLRMNLNDIKQIVMEGITKIENRAFSNLNMVKFEIILPETLTNIGDYAFMNSGAMNTIVVPSSVTNLGVGVFYSCGSIEYIFFREGISINTIPIQFCYSSSVKCVGIIHDDDTTTSKTMVTLPDSVTSIGESAFDKCANLGTSITFSDNVVHIGDYAFADTGIKNVTLGAGLATGSSTSQEQYQDANYTTERTITVPYTLYLTSKRQFRYKHFTIDSSHEAGFLYRLNDDDFKYSRTVYYYHQLTIIYILL